MSVYARSHTHGAPTLLSVKTDDDDWETDPDPANPISEREQRWGAATLPDDKKDYSDVHSVREAAKHQDSVALEQDAVVQQVVGARKQEYQQPIGY